MRNLVCVVADEIENHSGGIIYKDKNGNIIDDYLTEDELDNYCNDIKKVKKQYKRFILYRYLNEFDLFEYQEHSITRSGLERYFEQKYPNNVFDYMW